MLSDYVKRQQIDNKHGEIKSHLFRYKGRFNRMFTIRDRGVYWGSTIYVI